MNNIINKKDINIFLTVTIGNKETVNSVVNLTAISTALVEITDKFPSSAAVLRILEMFKPRLHQVRKVPSLRLPPLVMAISFLHPLEVQQHDLLPGLQLAEELLHLAVQLAFVLFK